MSNVNTEADAVAQLVQNLGVVQHIGDVPVVVHHENTSVTTLERLMERPLRIDETVCLLSTGALVAYVKRHATSEETVVMFNRQARSMIAVLDYHEAHVNAPAWCEHRAVLNLPYSRQLKAWLDLQQKKAVGQMEFADFIEEHILDVVSPTGSEMLGVAQSLEATKSERFASSIRLGNGDAEIAFKRETLENGSTKVPTRFKLGVPIFECSASRTPLEVLLRHRITDGKLTFSITIPTLEDVVDVVWGTTVEEVRAGLPSGVETFDAVCP